MGQLNHSQTIVSPHQKQQRLLIGSLNSHIESLESALRPLYQQRAGKILTGHHGDVVKAWCSACGEHTVNPTRGERFCISCETSLKITA